MRHCLNNSFVCFLSVKLRSRLLCCKWNEFLYCVNAVYEMISSCPSLRVLRINNDLFINMRSRSKTVRGGTRSAYRICMLKILTINGHVHVRTNPSQQLIKQLLNDSEKCISEYSFQFTFKYPLRTYITICI